MSKSSTGQKNASRTSQTNTLQLSNKLFYICAGILVLVILFLSFYNLGQFPARDWDEARHGVSGYEMRKTGNQIINTYTYAPDYWNLKPPLSFYGVQLGYLVFGNTLFGMRFYSALAFVLTIIGIGLFIKKRYGNLEAVIVLLLIACCAPFYSDHFARHGDADSLFSLFCVMSLLSMMLLEEKPWALYTCAGGFALAFLTKSWHAIFIAAVVGVVMFYKRIFLRLSLKQWLGFVAAGAIPIIIWGTLRYQSDGLDFFKKMVEIDLIDRSTQVLERHYGNFGYYFGVLAKMSPTTGYLPLFTIIMYLSYWLTGQASKGQLPNNPQLHADAPAILIWVFLPIVAFSLVRTKLWWYIYPIYFPILMATGVLMAQMLRSTTKQARFQRFVIIVVAGVMLVSSARVVWKVLQPPFEDPLQSVLWQEKDVLEETKGKNVYIANTAFSVEQGTQVYVLIGELYYDWKCSVDSAQAFLSNPAAHVLVIDEAGYLENAERLRASCKDMLRRSGYVILTKYQS